MKSLLSYFKESKKPKCPQLLEKIDGIDFKFRKNTLSKCVRISFKDKNTVLVTLPGRVPFNFARNFALKNLDNIKTALNNIESKNPRDIEALRQKARDYLPNRLKELAQLYGYKYNKVSLKYMKTRWGSCSYRNNINLNIALMNLEEELIDYVLLHELVHTVEKNHQEGFWTRLLMHMPDARLRQKIVKSRKVI